MEGICIGIDSRVTESCTNAQGEYTLFDLSERLYMIDVFSFLTIHSFTLYNLLIHSFIHSLQFTHSLFNTHSFTL